MPSSSPRAARFASRSRSPPAAAAPPPSQFEVRDTGIGIAPAKQALIFEPFRQADGSTSRKYGGSGLGLAISRKLAFMMSGELTVDSEPGAGSAFRFSAPFALSSMHSAKPTQPSPPHASGHAFSILLADDNAVNCHLTARLLSGKGHRVSVVNSGAAALARFRQESFDVILMDVQMPEMDGLTAAARIREYECATGKRVPIIAMTANAMKGDRDQCLAAGMDDYIGKPFQPEELFAKVEAHGRRDREPVPQL